MNHALRRLFSTVSTWILVSVSTLAVADNAADTSPGLEEIVVTATKRVENVQDVPIAIGVINSAGLQQQHIIDTAQLTDITPGVDFSRGSLWSQFYIRGIGSDLASPVNEAPVAVYVDGVYRADTASTFNVLQGAERVEILKGPQGTLYGRNASGGAVNIITEQPDEGFDGHVSGGEGNYDDHQGAFFVRGGSHELSASLSTGIEEREGYYRNLTDGSLIASLKVEYVMAKLRARPVDNVDITLAADFTKTDDTGNVYGNGPGFFPPTTPTGDINNFPPPLNAFGGGHSTVAPWQAYLTPGEDFEHYNDRGLSLTARINLPSADFVSISAIRNYDQAAGLDFDSTSAVTGHWVLGEFSQQATQEFQLFSTGPGSLHWIAGAAYFYRHSGFDPVNVIVFGQPAPDFEKAVTNSAAVYGEITYDFTSELSATVGGRFTRDEQGVVGSSLPTGAVPDQSTTWDKFIPRGTLKYKRPEGIYYATIAQGFKSGVYNLSGLSTVSNTPVNPETVTDYEVGSKWDFFDRRVQVDLSAFHYDYTNLQVNTFLGAENVGTVLENAAKAKLTGAELESTALVGGGLTLNGWLSWLHARYSSFPAASAYTPNYGQDGAVFNFAQFNIVPGGVDATGKQLIQAPNFSTALGFDYAVPLHVLGSVVFSAQWRYEDRYFLDAANTIESPAYNLFNAHISWTYSPAQKDKITVTAWGNNLSDAKYLLGGNYLVFGEASQWALPRTFGLTVRYDF